jgi:transposase
MRATRRTFTSAFKTKVVLEALKERQTTQELADRFSIHPNQIGTWKREFLDNAEKAFEGDQVRTKDHEQEKEELFKQIGQLQVEVNWLKKKVL